MIAVFITSIAILASNQTKGIDDIAQNAIYPSEKVNKEYSTIKYPKGITELMLNRKYHAYSADGAGNRVIVYFHGNGENLATLYKYGMFDALSQYGAFVAVDYPGYGLSKGVAQESTLLEAAQLAVEYAHNKFPHKKLVIWGWSLGAAPAALIARRSNPDALVLVSPWTNLKDLMIERSKRAKLVSKNWYKKNRYNIVEAVSGLEVPTLIVIADKDKTVPPNHSMEVYNSIRPDLANLLVIPNAKHNRIYVSEYFWNSLNTFLMIEAKTAYYEPFQYFQRNPASATK